MSSYVLLQPHIRWLLIMIVVKPFSLAIYFVFLVDIFLINFLLVWKNTWTNISILLHDLNGHSVFFWSNYFWMYGLCIVSSWKCHGPFEAFFGNFCFTMHGRDVKPNKSLMNNPMRGLKQILWSMYSYIDILMEVWLMIGHP